MANSKAKHDNSDNPDQPDVTTENEVGDGLSDDSVRSKDGEQERRPRGRMFLLLQSLMVFSLAILLLTIAAMSVVYQSAQQPPEFYEVALAALPEELAKDGSEFETTVLNLKNAARSTGDWQATFDADQINGWLAFEMPKKFPELVRKSISDPRVGIEEKNLRFACRGKMKSLDGIIVVEADLFLTNVINQVGVQIKQARCGMLPIPVSSIANQITEELAKQHVQVEWQTEEGDPVALLSLPQALTIREDGKRLELMNLEVTEGGIVVSGTTFDLDF